MRPAMVLPFAHLRDGSKAQGRERDLEQGGWGVSDGPNLSVPELGTHGTEDEFVVHQVIQCEDAGAWEGVFRQNAKSNIKLFRKHGFVVVGESSHPGFSDPTSCDMELKLG